MYISKPIFEGQKSFLRGFVIEFCPYVRLVFKKGLKSSKGYDGTRTGGKTVVLPVLYMLAWFGSNVADKATPVVAEVWDIFGSTLSTL